MNYLLKNDKKRELIILSVIYLLSQGFLIIATGRWWDDWCMHNQPTWVMWHFADQMGRPGIFPVMELFKRLPEPSYRIVTFVMMYFSALFLYKVLGVWLKCGDDACFWITALYMVIPANDSRILLAVFPYIIGLFFFMAGMSYLCGALLKEKLSIKDRICCYLLFLVSFTFNSILCFYALALLMLLTMLGSIKKFLTKHLDFIFLPIVFFAVKSKYFYTWGLYENYNQLTAEKVIEAFKLIFEADYNMIKLLINNWMGTERRIFQLVIIAIFVWIVYDYRKQIKQVILFFIWGRMVSGTVDDLNFCRETVAESKDRPKEALIILLVGFLALSAGLFPYVAVRQSARIPTSHFDGRDSALVALGAAMIIYALPVLLFKKKVRKYFLVGAVLCGIAYFNVWYLSYEQDWYRQLGFQYHLAQNYEELKDATNIVYMNNDSSRVNCQSFYQLNGNAEEVFGNQKRYVISGFPGENSFSETALIGYVESGNYHMSEYPYKSGYKRVDAVLEYSYSGGLSDTAKLKLAEIIMGEKKLEYMIARRSTMTVYLDGTEEYDVYLEEKGFKNLD